MSGLPLKHRASPKRNGIVKRIKALNAENQRAVSLKPLSPNQINRFATAIKERLKDKKDRKFAKVYLNTLIERIDASTDTITKRHNHN